MKDIIATERPLAPSGTYIEDPSHRMPRAFLDEAVYGQAIESFVIACTDAAIIDRAKRKIFLARRRSLPMRGWWIIGGRWFAGETMSESVRRAFRRETSLDLPEDRFLYARLNEYRWKDRQQEPQDKGSHNLAFTFLVELTPRERADAWAGLDKDEYAVECGLRPFDLRDLLAEDVHPMLIDLYRQIFPRRR